MRSKGQTGTTSFWSHSEAGALQYESDMISFMCSDDSGHCLENRMDRDKMAVGMTIRRISQKSREG